MWECVYTEMSFTLWACLRVAEQDHYKRCDVPEVQGGQGRDLVFVCVDVYVLSAERVRGGDCSIPPAGSIDFPAQHGDVGNVSL